MKKQLLIGVFSLLISPFVFSQNSKVAITWTDEMEKSKTLSFTDVLSRDADGFNVVYANTLSYMSAGTNTGVMERYDNNLKQIFSKELIVRFHNNEVAYFTANKIANQFYLFTTFWDNKEKVKYLLANTISKNGEVGAESKVLMEMPEQGRSAPNISFRTSFDTTKILLSSDLKEDKNEEESYYFKALDQNLNLIWENRLTLPYSSKNFEIEKYVIDNDANLHILGKVKIPRKEREKGEPGFYYTLITYFYSTKEIKEFKPDIGDAYASGIAIRPDKEGNIIAAGFYSEKSENSLKGAFYMKINPSTKSIITQKVKPFDVDFLSLFISAKKASKGKELYNYSIDHMDIDEEGNTIIMAEQYYVQVYTSTNSSGHTTTTTVYNYNHIMGIKFSATGEILWKVKIPKLQRSGSPTYFSYMYAMKDDMIYVLYNDHKKNIDEADPEKLYALSNAKDAITVMVSINKAGELEKLSMFEAKDTDGKTIFKPITSQYLSKSEYLVLSIRGKKYKIGKIGF